MDAVLPAFPTFDYETDKISAGPRRRKWLGRLMLHYAGATVYDSYDAEKEVGVDRTFAETRGILTNYFDPKTNIQILI